MKTPGVTRCRREHGAGHQAYPLIPVLQRRRFEDRFLLPPAEIQLVGEDKATKTPGKERFGLHSVHDYSPRRALPAGIINQTPLKDGFGLHSILILTPGGRCPPEM